MDDQDRQDSPTSTLATSLSKAWYRAAAVIGMLGAFNLIVNISDLLDLSETFGRLSEWWRYLTGQLFSLLPFSVPDPIEDVIVVVSVAMAATNLWFLREKGKNVFAAILDALRDDAKFVELFGDTGQRGAADPGGLVLMTVLISGTAAYFAVTQPPFGLLLLLYVFLVLAVLIAVIMMASASDHQTKFSRSLRWSLIFLVGAVLATLVLPVAYLVLWPIGTMVTIFAIAWKAVSRSAGVLVLLLLLNAFFAEVVEPFRGALDNLPRPPGAGPAPWAAPAEAAEGQKTAGRGAD